MAAVAPPSLRSRDASRTRCVDPSAPSCSGSFALRRAATGGIPLSRSRQRTNETSCCTWHGILATLEMHMNSKVIDYDNSSNNELLQRVIQQALKLLAKDARWKASGVAGLLARALRMAERRMTEAAARSAVAVLGFYKLAAKAAERLADDRAGHAGQCPDLRPGLTRAVSQPRVQRA